jgi:CoA:oxalate CoA-transferase
MLKVNMNQADRVEDPTVTSMPAKLPLAGVRVLTVDNYFAGNYGPHLLAQHGAEVVKIELPPGGDPLRRDAPYAELGSQKYAHGEARLMRGKSSIVLDLRREECWPVFERLVAEADVFWTNLRPSSAKRRGLDYESIKAIRPDIVYASLSGFGLPQEGGTMHDLPAFDIIVQAMTGLMTRNADRDGQPHYNGIAMADQVASLFATLGVTMALIGRQATGEGACVDVAMFDSMIALNEKTFTLFAMDGKVRPPRISATNSPFGAYRARDGFVVLGVGGDVIWRRFCEAIERTDLLAREDLASGVLRVAVENEVIRPIVEDWLADKTVVDALKVLHANDVPAGPVYEVDDKALIEQARRRGVVTDLVVEGASQMVVQSPIRFSGSPELPVSAPAAFGGQTDNVLRSWLQMADEEIAQLRSTGVVQ